MEHTPAEWVFQDDKYIVAGAWPLGSTICTMDNRNKEANARLIASAPKLLLALQSLQDPEGHIFHGPPGECTGECKDVREAVAAATGR